MATLQLDWLCESNDMDARLVVESIEEAWRHWAMCCCEERGGHWWTLSGDHPDDGSGITLECAHCPATGEDLDPCDYRVIVYGELGSIKIEGGIHNANDEFEIYVRAKVRVEQYGPNMDMIYPEYDVFVDIEPA